jgi:hypothetical protein
MWADAGVQPPLSLSLFHSQLVGMLLRVCVSIGLTLTLTLSLCHSQLVGMRYGALPIVRRTGGLGDTVHDLDDPRGHQVGDTHEAFYAHRPLPGASRASPALPCRKYPAHIYAPLTACDVMWRRRTALCSTAPTRPT